jgi:CRP/FNR family cyclic AMP-dependent transcriptional regulator
VESFALLTRYQQLIAHLDILQGEHAMVSPELLRRYPFFAGLDHDQNKALAKISDEISVEADYYFFEEEDSLSHFYLLLEGAAAIVFKLPARDVKHKISEQFAREFATKDVTVSTVGSGDVFGWSGLIPPFKATAGAKALTPCRVIGINSEALRDMFEDDYQFGYLMTQKAAQVIRDRLRDLRIESLASGL